MKNKIQKGYIDIANLVSRVILVMSEDQLQKASDTGLLGMCYHQILARQEQYDIEPQNLLCMFDSHSFRNEVIKKFNEENGIVDSGYKAGRVSVQRETIDKVLKLLQNLLQNLNYNTYQYNGLEADDIIGNFIMTSNSTEERHIIFSNDGDFKQLQRFKNIDVIQYSSQQKLEIDLTNEKALAELLLKVFNGDTSDNLKKVTNFTIDGITLPRTGKQFFEDLIQEKLKNSENLEDIIKFIIEKTAAYIYIKQITKPFFRVKDGKRLKDFIASDAFSKTNLIIEIEKIRNEILEQTLKSKIKKEKIKEESEKESLKTQMLNTQLAAEKKYVNPETIEEKIKKRVNHNNDMINFDKIPTHYQEKIQELKLTEIKDPLKGRELKKVLTLNGLYGMAKKVHIEDNIEDSNSEKEQPEVVKEIVKEDFKVQEVKQEEIYKTTTIINNKVIPVEIIPKKVILFSEGNQYNLVSGELSGRTQEYFKKKLKLNPQEIKILQNSKLEKVKQAWIIPQELITTQEFKNFINKLKKDIQYQVIKVTPTKTKSQTYIYSPTQSY